MKAVRSRIVAAASFVAVWQAGCGGYTPVKKQCPTCVVLTRHEPSAPIVEGTRTLFLLVPGLLGFGWEWDAPLAALRDTPGASVQVFEWSPFAPLARLASDLATVANAAWEHAPPSVERLVIVGHSAGGIVTAFAAAKLTVPSGRSVEIVNVGSPYAGMGVFFGDGPEASVWAPFAATLGFTIGSYPPPASGVTVESWVTSPSTDPVMKVRFGHHPENPRVGPPGRRVPLPENADHNAFLGNVVKDVLARVARARTSDGVARGNGSSAAPAPRSAR